VDLSALFTAYLASGRQVPEAAALAQALEAAGYALEATALRGAAGTTADLPGTIWHGRPLWTGAALPESARPRDLWLDTCQLTPMLLVPRDEDNYAWIDLRPMHRWQYAAFLSLAQFTPREVQLDPPLSLLDPHRILDGSFTDPVADLTPDEARLAANWFGKAQCGQIAWQLARESLSDGELSALWQTPLREWTGSYAEGEHIALSRTTIDEDPADEPPGMVYGEWAHRATITFRACVYLQLGLLTHPGEDGAWYLPFRLMSRAPR
jgi:hypothetical protein